MDLAVKDWIIIALVMGWVILVIVRGYKRRKLGRCSGCQGNCMKCTRSYETKKR